MLNLLRLSRLNPRLSVYAQLNGEFYFNRTPMDPLGTIILLHYKPHNRGTWAPHENKGWYVRPAMIHYRCLKPYIPKTSKVRFSNTTIFSPAKLTFPIIYSKDAATHAAADLTHTLLNPTPTRTLTALGDNQTVELRQLSEIFTNDSPFQETQPLRVHTQ